MAMYNPLDPYSLPTLFIAGLVIQLFFIELGFVLGKRLSANRVKAQASQVRAIMGAGLGLLAFMLAFTFAAGQSHFETRVAAMVEEARLARNAYLQAEFLPEPYGSEAKQILHKYVAERLKIDDLLHEGHTAEVGALIHKSEQMQLELWRLAVGQDKEASLLPGDGNGHNALFTANIAGLMDVHRARLEAAVMNRIPLIIWITLFLMAALSMLVMGYQASLVERRSPLATFTLAIALTAVVVLIMDLDRPRMSLFQIDNRVMINSLELMDDLSAQGERPSQADAPPP